MHPRTATAQDEHLELFEDSSGGMAGRGRDLGNYMGPYCDARRKHEGESREILRSGFWGADLSGARFPTSTSRREDRHAGLTRNRCVSTQLYQRSRLTEYGTADRGTHAARLGLLTRGHRAAGRTSNGVGDEDTREQDLNEERCMTLSRGVVLVQTLLLWSFAMESVQSADPGEGFHPIRVAEQGPVDFPWPPSSIPTQYVRGDGPWCGSHHALASLSQSVTRPTSTTIDVLGTARPAQEASNPSSRNSGTTLAQRDSPLERSGHVAQPSGEIDGR